VRCSEVKEAKCFYWRTETRPDSTCIDCRKKERRDRYLLKKQDVLSVEHTPKRIIEPKKAISEKHEASVHETVQITNKSDFTDMEMFCGKMGFNERCESVQRFNEYIALLREGYGELIGCDVYVRKD
jgi:hypothetical protein